jgi:hypothetical protein
MPLIIRKRLIPYLDLGTAKIRQFYTVDDIQYDPHAHHCLAPCTNAGFFNTNDSVRGVDLSVTRQFRWGEVEPSVRVGGAVFHHTLEARSAGTQLNMRGAIPTSLLGGGVSYRWIFVDATYYRGFGGGTEWSAGLPISKEFLVFLGGVRMRF